MGHADGICHIYADKDLDVEKAVKIIIDSKTQYTAVCNAAETLLVHKDAAEALLPVLSKAFREKNVEVRGTAAVQQIISCNNATEEDFKTEYLDFIISVKIVDDLEEAIVHINRYGSHHTDCIITENTATAEKFMQYVDSAGVYQNCSTRLQTDTGTDLVQRLASVPANFMPEDRLVWKAYALINTNYLAMEIS